MKTRNIFIILFACIFLAFTFLSFSLREKDSAELPRGCYMIEGGAIEDVCAALEGKGLRNVSVYKEWVTDFSETCAKKTLLPKTWKKLDELGGDLYSCADFWEASHKYSDADCRMTAMLLMGNLLQVDNPKKEYDGTYLMMDLDAVENEPRYSILKDDLAEFTTLFGEMEIPAGSLAYALPHNWKACGIHLDSENVSLISVVIEDTMSQTAFVGHAGLLIDMGDRLLFVEKLAFEQPYQATELSDIDELVKMLSSRPEYFAEEGKEPSVICLNDEVIGKIIP